MATSSFSKVGDLEDEEDNRLKTFEQAKKLFGKTLDCYQAKGASPEVLQGFEEAEAAMAPLIQCGLMGLRERELEFVLKNRLHQAAVMVYMEDRADRWSRVKALTEDVLQFDFHNSHALWLRGMALYHGNKNRKDAEEQMRRAVEYARGAGKMGEVEQWEAQIESMFGHSTDVPPANSSSTEAEVEQANPVEKVSSGKPSGMQRGFFNRKASPARHRSLSVKAEKSASSREKNSGGASSTLQSSEELQKRDTEIAQLRQQLADLQAEHERDSQNHQVRQKDLCSQLGGIGTMIEGMFEAEIEPANHERHDLDATLEEIKASVMDMRDRLQGDRAWAEGEHRQYLDCSTEVMTLREMTSREFKERQDATKHQMSELRGLAKSFNELKPSVKILRDRAKKQAVAQGQDDEEPDLHVMTRTAGEFHALPVTTKLAAFLDDAAVLRLVALALLLGALFALTLATEIFGYRKCRFVCAG